MNKIGMHIHSLQPEVYQALAKLRPPGAIIMNPTPQWIEDVRALMGSQFYLGVRKYEEGVVFWDRSAEDWADAIAAMCGNALHLVDGAITYNEPMPQGHDNPDHFPLFDSWQARVIRRLEDTHGLDALAFAFGTGQFTAAEDRVRLDVAFPESCGACHIITPHDYDWPNIWRSEGYRAMRWLAWLDDIEEAGHGRKEVIVSEWGLTQATYGGPDIGWRSGVSLDDYVRQMDEYNAKLCGMPEVKFFAPFNWGGAQFGWETFEHVPPGDFSVVDRISMIVCPEVPPEPPPEPPNGGNEMPEIRDFAGNLRDEQWLLDVWGVTIRRASPPVGQPYFKLAKVIIDEGPCAILNNVKDADGNPMEGILVAFHWPSAPDPPESGEAPHTTPVYPHDWRPNFVFGATGATGNWAGAMGVGAMDFDFTDIRALTIDAMMNEGGVGPHWDWIHHPDYPSDCASGLAWRTGTNHRSPRLFWILTTGEDGPSPDPPEEGALELREVLSFEHEANELGIAIPADYAVRNEARGDFFGPGIDEQIHPKEWCHPDTGSRMALISGCANFHGGTTETREYSIEAFNLATMERLTEKHSKTFPSIESGAQFQQWVYVYELADGNGEEPEPPPSDGGYVKELEYIGHRILAIAAHLKQADLVAEAMKDDIQELADLL